MYSCKECSWEVEDEEVEEMTNASNTNDEVKCPQCGSDTDWWDGTEEDEIL